MNEKIKLEEEDLLFIPLTRKRRLYALKSHGINTVEDFINCDIEASFKTTRNIPIYKAFQRILKNKYRGESIVSDVLLDKEYKPNDYLENLPKYWSDCRALGIEYDFNQKYTYKMIEEKYKQEGKIIKLIDFINDLGNFSSDYSNIAKFYNDYYKKHMNKDNFEISSATIEELKNEIISLLMQRNELDNKIAMLTEQVKTLEGGKSY